jgi:hypothetical protein
MGGTGADGQRHGLAAFFDQLAHPSNGLGDIGMALLAGGGGPLGNAAGALAQTNEQRAATERQAAQWKAEQARYDLERQDKLDERNWEHNKPEYFSGTEDRLKLDPSTGEVSTVYDAPRPEQDYARALGLDPNSPEGHKAIEDYVLRSSGPTAQAGDTSLEDLRYGHRLNLRGTPTWRQQHPLPGHLAPPRPATPATVIGSIMQKQASGAPLTPAEQQTLSAYRTRPGRAAPGGIAEGATATGPNGKRIVMRGGQWVPLN